MTLALLRPPKGEVERVMEETGMDRLQAHRHVQSRMYLLKVRMKNPYPLGKSQHFSETP